MKVKKLFVVLFGCLGLALSAHANEVSLKSNQPIKITFRVAHKNKNHQPVFGELQTINLNKKVTIPVSLGNYDRAGLVIISGNGHDLPPTANEFDKPEQCSMTTDKTKTSGTLELILTQHSISCHSEGGVFG